MLRDGDSDSRFPSMVVVSASKLVCQHYVHCFALAVPLYFLLQASLGGVQEVRTFHETPSGAGEARWPEEKTQITRIEKGRATGIEVVERRSGVRKCYGRKGARTLTPSWRWYLCAVFSYESAVSITPAFWMVTSSLFSFQELFSRGLDGTKIREIEFDIGYGSSSRGDCL